MSEVLPSVIFELGFGGVGGFIVGYAFKKLSKLLIVLLGLFIAVLVFLGLKGVISVNYEAFFAFMGSLLGAAGTAFSWLVHTFALLPFAASFIAGFLLGFKLA